VNESAGTLAPHALVSIIIPCRNEKRHIERFLSSAQAQDTNGLDVEYLVADGMSDDGTREVIRRIEDGRWKMEDGSQKAEVGSQRPEVCSQSSNLRSPISDIPAPSAPPRLRVIDNPRRIVSSGLNAAIRAARGDIIIRMDAHTEYAPDYVQQCVAVLHESGADNVGGPARTRADTYRQKAVAAAYHSPFGVGGARFHDVDYEGYVDTVTYGCWPRSTFEKFGYFDEELVRNQDDEHNLRIIRGGGRIWQSPKIRSWYRPRGSLTALFKQYMQYGYWKVRVIQKHKLPASWRHLVPGAFVLTLLLLLVFSVLCSLSSLLWPATTDHGPLTTDYGQARATGLWDHGTAGPLTTDRCAAPARLLVGLLGLYALCVLAASAITAARSEWKLLPVLPFVFPCYHFGYGYGFLRGVLDFVVLRRGASASFTSLTRNSPEEKANVRADH